MSLKQLVATDKAPAAIGPYSQATIHNGTCYVSGCIGLVPGAEKPTLADGVCRGLNPGPALPTPPLTSPAFEHVCGQGIEGQTRQALDNLKAVVEAAGGQMINVLKTTVLLSGDMSTYPVVNGIYAEYFPESPPARAAFAVAALPAGALIEIECIVALESK